MIGGCISQYSRVPPSKPLAHKINHYPVAEMNNTESKEFLKIFSELMTSFKTESDRGCVLVIGTFIENELSRGIENRLIDKANNDDLVSRSIQSFGFGARIDFAYRLGIITPAEHKIFHQLRKLRNDCAHKIEEQNFNKDHFKTRIENIIKESEFLWDILKDKIPIPNVQNNREVSIKEFVNLLGWRIAFEMFFSLMIAHKKASHERITRINPLYYQNDYNIKP